MVSYKIVAINWHTANHSVNVRFVWLTSHVLRCFGGAFAPKTVAMPYTPLLTAIKEMHLIKQAMAVSLCCGIKTTISRSAQTLPVIKHHRPSIKNCLQTRFASAMHLLWHALHIILYNPIILYVMTVIFIFHSCMMVLKEIAFYLHTAWNEQVQTWRKIITHTHCFIICFV